MQNLVVAVSHVLGPGKLGKRGVLLLPYVVKFVRVSILVSWRVSFTDEICIVVFGPLVIVLQLLLRRIVNCKYKTD